MSEPSGFHRLSQGWACESVLLEPIAARFGTPCYVYSRSVLLDRYGGLCAAFALHDPLICFSVKACSNLTILSLLASQGSGFDIVSGGELYRVLKAGGDPAKVFFAGVGKQRWEIEYALREGVGRFNAESESELVRISETASRLGSIATVALRVNPDVDPATHRYITTGREENKFGVDRRRAAEVIRRAVELPGLRLRGLHCHIGSQIRSIEPYVEMVWRLRELMEQVGLERFDHLDLGGGFGVDYGDGLALDPKALALALEEPLRGLDVALILEPGRSIVAPAGVLLTRVIESKRGATKEFVIVDAAMNDFIRPSLYQAEHRISPVTVEGPGRSVQVVGPICETADFLSGEIVLPDLHEGDLLMIRDTGAYGMTMASQYNSRPRAAEVLVDGSESHLIRRRETLDDLVSCDLAPPLSAE